MAGISNLFQNFWRPFETAHLHRNCRAVVKEEANYAAQFGAPFYIEKWKKSQLQIAICSATVLSANTYASGAGESQSN